MKEVHEILQAANDAEDPVQVLKDNMNPSLKTVLRFCWDRTLVINLPDSAPPVLEEERDTEYPETLSVAYKTLRLFVGENNLSPMRRESKFFGLLKILSKEESDILVAAITRDNKEAKDLHFTKLYPNLKKKVISDAIGIKL